MLNAIREDALRTRVSENRTDRPGHGRQSAGCWPKRGSLWRNTPPTCKRCGPITAWKKTTDATPNPICQYGATPPEVHLSPNQRTQPGWYGKPGWYGTDFTTLAEDDALRIAIGIVGNVLIMENMNRLQRCSRLIGEIARYTKDGECGFCGKDGDTPNPQCREHYVYVQENDDAHNTLQSLISAAREIMEGA